MNTYKPTAFQIITGDAFNNVDRANNPRWITGNLNGDGFPDLVIRYDPDSSFTPNMIGHSPLQAFIGSASGKFIKDDSIFQNATEPTLVNAIVAGSFNNDDKIDIAVAASGQDPYENGRPVGPWLGETSYFYISSISGYTSLQNTDIPTVFAHHASVGDVNQDGYDDVYISSLTGSPSYFLLSSDNGIYNVTRANLPQIISNGSVRYDMPSKPDGTLVYFYPSWTSDLIADLNGDGWKDLALFASAAGGPNRLFLNDGTGNFPTSGMRILPQGPYGESLQYTTTTGNTYTIGSIFLDSQTIDINNDGLNDIVSIVTSSDNSTDDYIYYRGATLQVLINKLDHFDDETQSRTDFLHTAEMNFTHYDKVSVTDFNQDGFQDILIYRSPGNVDGEHATIFLLNDGYGFLRQQSFPSGIADGLFIPVDPENGVFCLANSTRTNAGVIQSVDTLKIQWGASVDFFTGLPTEQNISLQSDIPGRWIHGNAQDNVIRLSSSQERAWGYAGNDTFIADLGNDTLDGGDGTDKVTYNAASYRFATVYSPERFLIKGYENTYGTDHAISIENIQFLDLTLETSWFSKTDALTSPQSDSLVELYIASFNRAPDAIGLNYWGGRLYDGMPLPQIAKSFFVQPETVAAYPSSMLTQTFVTTVYNNVLSRAPDTEGRDYWIREIDTGSVSKDVFLLAIINGAKASTGSATDRQTLANKVSVGNHFAFDEGLNNTTWGLDVMDSVTHLASTVTDANALTDRYSDAIGTGASSLGMPMSLVGIDANEPVPNLM